jgi:putative protease
VQDIGVARLVKETVPQFTLHASTQMTIHSLGGVQKLEQLGFKRVVLARELNSQEIQHICKNTSLEIEVFVHGALCMGYSGQCLMSSMIGGRSGNRGRCAQPCRLPYSLVDMGSGKVLHDDPNRQYLLSPKDQNLIEHLEVLKKAGVKSLKLEGRMKRPEYVAVVTRQYRHYLDSGLEVQPKDYEELLQVFNRGGFTQGYLQDEVGEHMMSYEKPKNWGVHIGSVAGYNTKKKIASIRLKSCLNIGDGIEICTKGGQDPGVIVNRIWLNNREVDSVQKGQVVNVSITGDIHTGDKVYKTSDVNLYESAKQSFTEHASMRTVPIYGKCSFELEKPICLSIWDDEGNYIEGIGEKPAEQAVSKGLDEHKVLQQLNKLGGTPYRFEDISVSIEPGLALPISEINNVRRNAIQQLEQQRINRYIPDLLDASSVKRRVSEMLRPVHFQHGGKQIKLAIQVDTYEQAKELAETDMDRIVIPAKVFLDKNIQEKLSDLTNRLITREIAVCCAIPRIIRQKELTHYEKLMELLQRVGVTSVLVGNIGHVDLVKGYNLEILGDYSLNIFNSVSITAADEMGLKTVTLSPELTFSQIRDIKKSAEVEPEIIVYGRLPLMIVENCPVGNLSKYIDKDDRCCCDHKQYGLVDRKGIAFPLRTDKMTCKTEILNSQPIFLADKMDEVVTSGIDSIKLLFTVENPSRCKEIASIYQTGLQEGADKAVQVYQEKIERIMSEGFTRGHYYRGVE